MSEDCTEEIKTEYGRPHFLMQQQLLMRQQLQRVSSEDDESDDDDSPVNLFLEEEESGSDSDHCTSSSSSDSNDNECESTAFSLHLPRNAGLVSGLSCFDSMSTLGLPEDWDNKPSPSMSRKGSISSSSHYKNNCDLTCGHPGVAINGKVFSNDAESSNANRKKSRSPMRRRVHTNSFRQYPNDCSNTISEGALPSLKTPLKSHAKSEGFQFGSEWTKLLPNPDDFTNNRSGRGRSQARASSMNMASGHAPGRSGIFKIDETSGGL